MPPVIKRVDETVVALLLVSLELAAQTHVIIAADARVRHHRELGKQLVRCVQKS